MCPHKASYTPRRGFVTWQDLQYDGWVRVASANSMDQKWARKRAVVGIYCVLLLLLSAFHGKFLLRYPSALPPYLESCGLETINTAKLTVSSFNFGCGLFCLHPWEHSNWDPRCVRRSPQSCGHSSFSAVGLSFSVDRAVPFRVDAKLVS